VRWLPNSLSLLRLALSPLCAALILAHQYRQALVAILIAGITDFLDGYLARLMRLQTKAGALLDPLADKALIMVTYVSLAAAGAIPEWLAGVIVGRDAAILAGAAALYLRVRLREFPPSRAGKMSTTIQIAGGAAIVCAEAGLLPRFIALTSIAAVTIATLASGLDYFVRGWRMMAAARHS
jgi:cardiolipin synthase